MHSWLGLQQATDRAAAEVRAPCRRQFISFLPRAAVCNSPIPNGINAGSFPMLNEIPLVLRHSNLLSACIYDCPTLCACLGFVVPLKQGSQYQTKVSMTDGTSVGCPESIRCIAKKACLSCAPYHALEVSAFCHLT